MALHGREADLAILDDVLASARAGRGRALFLTGEAGIGKSTLLAEARTRANDFIVLSGAAWESGGAPPYWPWLQILREAADRCPDRVRRLPGADRIATLVPSWVAASGTPTSGVQDPAASDPAAARFALLDAVVRALITLAREQPLVVVLDDLHAADIPTLDLLVLLVREVPAAPLAVIAAWREGELAVRGDAAQRLARASRTGIVHPLRRLTADEIAAWVGADAPAIFASSEGNPLFVEELLRARRGGAAHGLQTVLGDHLALVGDATRELLAIASVLGREIDPMMLRSLAERDDDAIAHAMREATSASIVEKRERGWAFRHVLLRDHLHDALPPTRRAALHRALGEILEAVDPARAAHHLLAGIRTAEDLPRALAATRAAAARATKIYAFEDAADLLVLALDAVEKRGAGETTESLDLRLALGEALHRAGRTAQARAVCVRTQEIAIAQGDTDRTARAALVYAIELYSGRRDPVMIAMLEKARAALPATDSPMLARVTVRLAAALVPTYVDPDAPQILAREAVAMARRIDDDETTFFVLRFAAHAFGFQLAVVDSIKLAREVIALSDRLERPLESLEHRTYLFGACISTGDMAAAERALESVAALLAPLAQPQYRWRVPVLRAVRSIVGGDLLEAERQLATVKTIAAEHDLERARMVGYFSQLGLIDATRSVARARKAYGDIQRVAHMLGGIADAVLAYIEAIIGEHAKARARLRPELFTPGIIILQFGAEAVVILGERALAPGALLAMQEACKLHPITNGPAGGLIMRPVEMCIGELLVLLDRIDEGIAALESGLALARKIDGVPFIANGAAALARALDKRGRDDDRARAVVLAAEAQQLNQRCNRDDLIDAAAASESITPASNTLSLASAGDRHTITWRGMSHDVPASKGGDYLVALLAAPGREIHVSDLVGDDDRGDAGDILDAKARAAYKQRAEELTAELEQARARHDLGRTERLAAELDAITDELVAATGLGGRARKAGSRIDRARVNVQRRIKDAIRRLGGADESLGRYLEATVHTGTFCSYVPVDS